MKRALILVAVFALTTAPLVPEAVGDERLAFAIDTRGTSPEVLDFFAEVQERVAAWWADRGGRTRVRWVVSVAATADDRGEPSGISVILIERAGTKRFARSATHIPAARVGSGTAAETAGLIIRVMERTSGAR